MYFWLDVSILINTFLLTIRIQPLERLDYFPNFSCSFAATTSSAKKKSGATRFRSFISSITMKMDEERRTSLVATKMNDGLHRRMVCAAVPHLTTIYKTEVIKNIPHQYSLMTHSTHQRWMSFVYWSNYRVVKMRILKNLTDKNAIEVVNGISFAVN